MCQVDIQYSFERNPLWHLKLRLQHTGWLQYIPPLAFGQLLLMLSYAFAPYFSGIASMLTAIGKSLLTIGVFDILTVKYNIRPPEPFPKRRIKSEDNCSIMQLRRSCRSFQPRKLRDEDRQEITKIARIESKQTLGTAPIRFEYIDKSLKVWPVVNAREFFVAIGPAEYDRASVIDVGRSLQGVVLHATRMGLGTCWIGPGADHDSITTALMEKGVYDNERDHIICVCAIGYKSIFLPVTLRLSLNMMSRTRKSIDELFFDEGDLRLPFDTTKYPFSRFQKCYEAARWSPSSFNAQPTRCVGTVVNMGKVRFDFFSSTASRYYAPVAVGIWLRDWEAACEAIGIKGRFAVLPNQERGIEGNISPKVPVYDMSWIEE